MILFFKGRVFLAGAFIADILEVLYERQTERVNERAQASHEQVQHMSESDDQRKAYYRAYARVLA